MIATQIVTTQANAGSITAYARTGNREHAAISTSSDLAVRLAAAGVHRLQLVDVQHAERICLGVWKVSFRHGAYAPEAAR